MARPIEKRGSIEEGLIRAVGREGLLGTTIQDIAEEAGVSPGLLYRYWKDREELARDVFCRTYEELMQRLLSVSGKEATFWGRMRVMVDEFLAYADAEPVKLRFLLLTQHDLSSAIPEPQRIAPLLGRLIGDGIAAGEIREIAPALVLQYLLGVVVQPVIGAIYRDVASPVRQHREEILSSLWRVLHPAAVAPGRGDDGVQAARRSGAREGRSGALRPPH